MADTNQKVIYYSDELNDEFSEAVIEPRKIDSSYVYVHTSLWKKFTHVFWLRIILCPIAKGYLFFKFRHKTFNKHLLRKFKKQGFFTYGNHTHNVCDAFIPTMINGYHDTYIIANPENVSVPGIGNVAQSLGAIPLPADREATRNFIKCIETRIRQKRVINIYPEAHIWPFYTKIRPFKSTSFRYPVEYNTPVFCFTNVYKKRKHSKNPRIETYIDGPFYPDLSLSKAEAKQKLRDEVYNTMVERSKLNDVEIIKYIKKES